MLIVPQSRADKLKCGGSSNSGNSLVKYESKRPVTTDHTKDYNKRSIQGVKQRIGTAGNPNFRKTAEGGSGNRRHIHITEEYHD